MLLRQVFLHQEPQVKVIQKIFACCKYDVFTLNHKVIKGISIVVFFICSSTILFFNIYLQYCVDVYMYI